MAKALYGHLGGPDARLLSEVSRLRARVGELEAELSRLRAATELPAIGLDSLDTDLLTLPAPEPALA
ncbi:MAG: hypothetical protein EPO13_01725 [Actinomycetota bacterium]|nr:MAG: hypothetical protein EPO13_01725 [Actinomycetota bacterium]